MLDSSESLKIIYRPSADPSTCPALRDALAARVPHDIFATYDGKSSHRRG